MSSFEPPADIRLLLGVILRDWARGFLSGRHRTGTRLSWRMRLPHMRTGPWCAMTPLAAATVLTLAVMANAEPST